MVTIPFRELIPGLSFVSIEYLSYPYPSTLLFESCEEAWVLFPCLVLHHGAECSNSRPSSIRVAAPRWNPGLEPPK